jgi:hypothetical protein
VGKVIRLTVVPDEGEADILCQMLRAEQIRCAHRTTDVAAERGMEFGGWREILVDEADFSRARELLPDG